MFSARKDQVENSVKAPQPFTEWMQWLGMEHQTGADPRTDGKACCLIIAEIVATTHGIRFPVDSSELIARVRRGDIAWVETVFEKHTQPVDNGYPGCIALLKNETAGYGIGTVVSDGNESNLYLLIPHHKRGLIAISTSSIRGTQLYQIIQ
jgi:hypothetical protein